jgi:hypothetical protein
MPKFKIHHSCNHDLETTYSKIKKFLGNDSDFKKMDPQMVCKFFDDKKKVSADGSKFKATMTVSQNPKEPEISQVEIEVDLPLLLSPFKGKVQDMLSKKLNKLLG